MERIKALQARLNREARGEVNLLYMNALAELHNNAARLHCDYRTLTPPERTAFVRKVGKETLRNRQLCTVEGILGAEATVTGAAAVPHMAALELLDWIEELRETLEGTEIPILLYEDRDSEIFSHLCAVIGSFYENVRIQLKKR